MIQLARRIEHTLLKPEATREQIDALCDEAIEHGMLAVCVSPARVRQAVERLNRCNARRPPFVVSVVGFPHGTHRPEVKAEEARLAMEDGALEIDMVLNRGALFDGDKAGVRREIELLARVAHGIGEPRKLKVILECSTLTEEQIILACRCAMEGEADFVKTSTGFHPTGGATVEHVRMLHRYASPMKTKAAGGIRTAAQANEMIQAGAERIGTSHGVSLLREFAA